MSDLTSWINKLMESPAPIALALVLNLVGMRLKKSPVPNWLIPWILMLLGGIIFPFICDRQTVVYNAYYPSVYTFVLGVAIGGLSVAVYEGVTGFQEWRGKATEKELPKDSHL